MRRRFITLCTTLLFVASFAFAIALPAQPAAAQDMQPVVCDSTLVLLLYIAEHDHGFQSMHDVSTLDKGQYAPWFDAMMAMMDEGMEATADPMMEATAEMMEEEPMGEESMGDEMMTTLVPGNVAGEPELCTQVRAEVEAFLVSKLSESLMQ
jgi:hypothetical protein